LRTYSQLTLQQRTQFQILKASDMRIVDIALRLGVDKSSLYREQARNAVAGNYDSCTADDQAKARKAIPRSPTKCTPENRRLVENLLLEDLSPDVIAGRAKLTGEGPQICANTIYKIIEQDRDKGGKLCRLLPNKGRRSRNNRTGVQRKGRLQTLPEQELATRPIGIDERREPGHLEMDLVFSGETVWLTFIDRYTRKIDIRALASKESEPVAVEILLLLSEGRIRSITTDRGLEWAQINPMVLALSRRAVSVYFCNAYCSWEKGAIEQANGLLRRYFPKGKNLPWSEEQWIEAQRVADVMNRKPRKILGYRTPDEVEKEWNLTRRRAAWKETMASGPAQAA
jgi:IS30 family transposase